MLLERRKAELPAKMRGTKQAANAIRMICFRLLLAKAGMINESAAALFNAFQALFRQKNKKQAKALDAHNVPDNM